MGCSIQKFREIVFQLLYSRDFKQSDWEEAETLIMRQFLLPKKVVQQAKEKVDAIWDERETLDQIIHQHSKSYDLERILRVERAILRLGLYELLHAELPPKVAISEAIRLTRKFATKEAAGYINALLDAFYKEMHESLSTEQVVK